MPDEAPVIMTEDVDVKTVMSQRTLNRRQVTLNINQARTIINSPRTDNYKSSLIGISELLRRKVDKLDELDTIIISKVEEDVMEKESNDANKYQMDGYQCLAEIDEALNKLDPPHVPAAGSHRWTDNDADLFAARKQPIQLPKIIIPPFDGNPLHYQSFVDSFGSSIDTNQSLSNVEKFLYLKGFLKGKALSTIEGLSLTASNYDEAINLLKERFGDQKLLVATFFDELLKLPPCQR